MTEARGLLVLEPGLLTTVQDLGRPGWASFGVPAAGALDEEALRLANRSSETPRARPPSRSRSSGPVLRAAGDLELAVVGGAFGPAPGKALRVADGEVDARLRESRRDARDRRGRRRDRRSARPREPFDVRLGPLRRLSGTAPPARGLSRGRFAASAAPLVGGARRPARSRATATSSSARSRDRTKPSSTPTRARRSGARAGGSSRSRTAWASGSSGPSLGLVETASRASEGTTPGDRPDDGRRAPDRAPRRAADDGRLPEDRRRRGRRPRSPRADAAGPERAL